MHGVRKVATSEEEKEALRLKRARKLADYVKARDIVLAKHAQKVYDAEGLGVSEALLSGQPDVGTFWNYRRLCLLHLESTLPQDDLRRTFEAELRLTFQCLGKNPKSYGSWHQRGWVLARIPSPDWNAELKIIAKALEMDERNFHCWDHRRLVCRLAQIPAEDELKFSEEKVAANFSNYSAWHYRGSLLPGLRPPPPLSRLPLDPEALKKELNLALNAFYTDPEDQAAWLYTSFLLQEKEEGGEVKEIAHSYRAEEGKLLLLLDPIPADPVQVVKISSRYGALSMATADGSRTSALWILSQFPDSGPKELEKITWWDEDRVKEYLLGSRPPTDIAEALEAQLKACQELGEEEGEGNMWPRYIAALCMHRLDPGRFTSEIDRSLRGLERADSKRAGYYRALRSRLLIARAILDQLESQTLDLRQLDISCLAFTDVISVLFPKVCLPPTVDEADSAFPAFVNLSSASSPA